MQYITHYHSPLGKITLAADKTGLTGLWFEGQKYFALHLGKAYETSEEKELPVFADAKRWLDIYFSGRETRIFHCRCISQEVIFKMRYGEFFLPFLMVRPQPMVKLQNSWLKRREVPQNVSAGSGRGRRKEWKYAIIVPCHRVVGTNGSLTGYAGGIRRKIALLKLEGAWKENYYVPKKSTAP